MSNELELLAATTEQSEREAIVAYLRREGAFWFRLAYKMTFREKTVAMFDAIKVARQRGIGWRGILRYVFGHSPAVVAAALAQAAAAIEAGDHMKGQPDD